MRNGRRRSWLAGCSACSLLVLGATLGVSGAGAAPRTTEPAVLTQVPATITNKGLTIARDQYTRGGTARFPRGAIIDFVIKNRGTHFYRARLALQSHYVFSKYEQNTKTVTSDVAAKPGGTIHLKINFYFRSKFALQAILAGKAHGTAAPIVIF
jgi:hypothetical protein